MSLTANPMVCLHCEHMAKIKIGCSTHVYCRKGLDKFEDGDDIRMDPNMSYERMVGQAILLNRKEDFNLNPDFAIPEKCNYILEHEMANDPTSR